MILSVFVRDLVVIVSRSLIRVLRILGSTSHSPLSTDSPRYYVGTGEMVLYIRPTLAKSLCGRAVVAALPPSSRYPVVVRGFHLAQSDSEREFSPLWRNRYADNPVCPFHD
jgi:hypothetical protein